MRSESRGQGGAASRRRFLAGLLFLLGAQAAHASDMSGMLGILVLGGGLLGCVVGLVVCLVWSLAGGRGVWRKWPLFPLLGCGAIFLYIQIMFFLHRDRTVAKIGPYYGHQGGTPAVQVPDGFTRKDLKRFYDALNDKKDPILAPYEFAVALIHQSNGITQVYLNTDPPIPFDDFSMTAGAIDATMTEILRGPNGRGLHSTEANAKPAPFAEKK